MLKNFNENKDKTKRFLKSQCRGGVASVAVKNFPRIFPNPTSYGQVSLNMKGSAHDLAYILFFWYSLSI